MAEPKREEEKVIPINAHRTEQGEGAENPENAAAAQKSESAAGADASLTTELQKLKAEKEELMQTMIRRQADFENYKKRLERERHEEGRRGVERLILDLIPVLDAFDRALQAHDAPAYDEYRRGVNLIRKQLWDSIAKHGVQRIDAAGKVFDPHLHQAIERHETTDMPDGSIVEVFQDGYLFHGKVLRPAIVKVAVHPGDDGSSAATEN